MRFSLTASAILILALAGCATPQQKEARLQKKAERQAAEEDSRTIEQRRMFAMENGSVSSARGASILYPNKNQTFDANAHSAANVRGFETKGATTKEFYSDRQMRVEAYQTRDYYGAKPNSATDRKYATADADTKSKHVIPNATKPADVKTAATRELWDAGKVAAARSLWDGKRPYLGPESKKLGTAVPAKELANWQKGGETVVYSDGAVEKISNMKTLSIDDVRELLNKSK